jgi:hypothetical protein
MGDLLPVVRSLQSGGLEALADYSPRPDRVWNRIPDEVRERIIKLAFDEPTLSPRKLALHFADTETISLINIDFLVPRGGLHHFCDFNDLALGGTHKRSTGSLSFLARVSHRFAQVRPNTNRTPNDTSSIPKTGTEIRSLLSEAVPSIRRSNTNRPNL